MCLAKIYSQIVIMKMFFSNEHMFEVPHLIKNDYFLISIEDDGYVTLLNEETYDTRSDLKLKNKFRFVLSITW